MKKDSALNKQIAGTHYKSMAIQPVEFITKNSIGFLEGNIIKYVCRHHAKNGIDDIKKAIHYCELLIETKYGGKVEAPENAKFQVGDHVISSENGTGIVKEYNERKPYPVWVVFDAKCGVSYTDDGRSYKSRTITLTHLEF